MDFSTHLRASGDAQSTIDLRTRHLAYLAAAMGRPADTATAAELETFLGTPGWSSDYRRSVRSTLTTYFRWLEVTGQRAGNPTATLPRCKAAPPHPRPLPEDAWQRARRHEVPTVQAMARLAGEAGLRRSEIAQAHQNDLWRDLLGWTLTVHGKGGKDRDVPISDELAGFLRAHCGAAWMFPGRFDGHLSSDNVGRQLKALCPPGFSGHSFRHRYASVLYGRTQDIRAVQELLGHSSIATTQRYVAMDKRRIREVAALAA